jgi:preprotein translocase subunit Sec63
LILLFLLAGSLEEIKNTKQIKTFDPYEILEIEFNASAAEIKRAYRYNFMKFHEKPLNKFPICYL